jgi:hypothetical protein
VVGAAAPTNARYIDHRWFAQRDCGHARWRGEKHYHQPAHTLWGRRGARQSTWLGWRYGQPESRSPRTLRQESTSTYSIPKKSSAIDLDSSLEAC